MVSLLYPVLEWNSVGVSRAPAVNSAESLEVSWEALGESSATIIAGVELLVVLAAVYTQTEAVAASNVSSINSINLQQVVINYSMGNEAVAITSGSSIDSVGLITVVVTYSNPEIVGESSSAVLNSVTLV